MGEEHIILTAEEHHRYCVHRERIAHIAGLLSNLDGGELPPDDRFGSDLTFVNDLADMRECSANRIGELIGKGEDQARERMKAINPAFQSDLDNYFGDPEKDEIWRKAFEIIKGPEDGEQYRALRALLKPEPLKESAPDPAIQERLDEIFTEAQ